MTRIRPYAPTRPCRPRTAPSCWPSATDRQFETFAKLIEQPELATDPRFATNAARVENRSALMQALAPRAGVAHSDGVGSGPLRCPHPRAAPCSTSPPPLEHPQLAARGSIFEVEHPLAGAVKNVRSPVRLSEPAQTPAPRLGEHTAEVLGEHLSLKTAEIDRLVSEGVVALTN